MGIFNRFDDNDYLNDDQGSLFSCEDRETRQRRLDRAKEIASGLVAGTFENDEKVWDLVKKLKEFLNGGR